MDKWVWKNYQTCDNCTGGDPIRGSNTVGHETSDPTHDSYEWGFSRATTSLIKCYWYKRKMEGEAATEEWLQNLYDTHNDIINEMKK